MEDGKNLQLLTQFKRQEFDLDSAEAALQTNSKSTLPFWPMDWIECFDDAVWEKAQRS